MTLNRVLLLWVAFGMLSFGQTGFGGETCRHRGNKVRSQPGMMPGLAELQGRLKLRHRRVYQVARWLKRQGWAAALKADERSALAELLVPFDLSELPVTEIKHHRHSLAFRSLDRPAWTLLEQQARQLWQERKLGVLSQGAKISQARQAYEQATHLVEKFRSGVSLMLVLAETNQLNPMVSARLGTPMVQAIARFQAQVFGSSRKREPPKDLYGLIRWHQKVSRSWSELRMQLAEPARPTLSLEGRSALLQADWIKRQLVYLSGTTKVNLWFEEQEAQAALRSGPPEGLWNRALDSFGLPGQASKSSKTLGKARLRRVQRLARAQRDCWGAWQTKQRRFSAYQFLADQQRPYLEQLDRLVSQVYPEQRELNFKTRPVRSGFKVTASFKGRRFSHFFKTNAAEIGPILVTRTVRLLSKIPKRVSLIRASIGFINQQNGEAWSRTFERPEPSFEAKAYEKLVSQTLPNLARQTQAALENFIGQTHRWDDALQVELAWIKGGCFKMGCEGDSCQPSAQPQRQVCVDSFLLSPFEVTQQLWTQVMGKNPSKFQTGPNYPVDSISYEQAQAFLDQLERLGFHYRLPTEAEWEYACRAGRSLNYGTWRGQMSHQSANFAYTQGRDQWGETSPVGSFPKNRLGLFDLSGNISEWVSDQYAIDFYQVSVTQNPVNRNGAANVLRGGSWLGGLEDLTCFKRTVSSPSYSNYTAGFRLVRVP